MPTAEQALGCVRVCQMLSNLYLSIYLFRYDANYKTVFILIRNKFDESIANNYSSQWIDYKNMTQQQLKEHLILYRNDEEAWRVFFERLSHLDPNQGYSADLPPEEMEKIFKAKLNRTI